MWHYSKSSFQVIERLTRRLGRLVDDLTLSSAPGKRANSPGRGQG